MKAPRSLGAVERPHIPDHELLRPIGRGSYGAVWLARTTLGTFRAVKIVHRDAFDSARPYEREFSGIQRFEPVSRSHEGLVDILQVGRNDGAECFYYVMELADAVEPADEARGAPAGLPAFSPETYSPRTLAADLQRHRRLPVAECLPLFLNLAAALGHLHRHGLLHRDLKPSNIIFVGGVAKLADIGLVAEANEAASFVGTEGFIPPEGPGTRQADLYSLGKVFYEVATGKDRTEFPSLPIELDELDRQAGLLEINAVIVKACTADPRQRYQTAEELSADLAVLRSGRSIRRLRQVEQRLGRARRVLAVAGAITLLALLASLVARVQAGKERTLRNRAEAAEQSAREQLWQARLNEARALRGSHEAGSRAAALAALRDAARVRVDHALRSEAAACLALVDVVPVPFDSPTATSSNRLAWLPGLSRYLWTLPDGSVEVRDRGHRVHVRLSSQRQPLGGILDVSPGGRWLFATYADGSDALWDLSLTNGGPRWSFEFFWRERVFAPDDSQLALIETNNVARVFELASRRETGRVTVDASAGLFALGAGGRVLASAAVQSSREFALWDVASGWLIRRVPTDSAIVSLRFVDGDRLLVATTDNDLHLFDAAGNRAAKPLVGHLSDIVETVPLAGDWLLTRSWDGSARLWDTRTGRTVWRQASDLAGFGFSRDEGCLGSYDDRSRQLKLQRFTFDAVVRSLPHLADEKSIGPGALSFSRDGRLLVSTDADGARFWHLPQGRLAARLEGLPGYASFGPAAGEVLDVNDDAGVAVRPFSLTTAGGLELGAARPVQPGPAVYFRSATNDARMWFDGRNGRIRLNLRAADGRLVQLTDGERGIPEKLGYVGYAELSPDGRWAYAATRFEHRAWVWDVEAGRLVLDEAVRFGAAGAFVPGQAKVLIGDYECYRLFELGTGKPAWTFQRPQGGNLAGALSISPDGTVAAVLLDRSRVTFLSVASGTELLTLAHPMPEAGTSVLFSPDGRFLAVGNETHVVHLWDLAALRRELGELGFGWEPGLESLGR